MSMYDVAGAWARASVIALLGAAILASGCSGCGGDPPVESEGTFFVPVGIGEFEIVREPSLIAPPRIDYGVVEAGDVRTETIEVRNDGRAALEIFSWEVEGEDFSVAFPEFMDDSAPRRLEPGASVLVSVTYRATSSEEAEGALVIQSNDPKRAVAVIDLLANIASPCLQIDPPELDFGTTSPNTSRTSSFKISSCSELAETTFTLIERDTTEETGFIVLDPARLRDVTLGPGEEVEMFVEFTPPAPGEYQDEFVLVSNVDEETTHTLPVYGQGAPYRCPRAVIEARHPDREGVTADPEATYTGLPLDVVRLLSTGSYSPEGFLIERVEWALVNRPADSAAMLANDPDVRRNELFLDLSGDYVVELNVWDERGTKSCEPARLKLRAIPDEDIHIQLVWDTPNDPEQLDRLGTDVDLHLLRTGGIWNDKPWDCFWQNLEPDWGRRADRSDDPSLDIDDVDGWGPENINLNNPENNMRYHVGVHYFSDQGYGTSYATVRLYLGGVLVQEMRRKRLTDQQFWHVLDIDWPSRDVTLHDARYPTFPQGVFPPDD